MRDLKHRILALTLIVTIAVGLAVPALALESQASGKMPIMHPLALLKLGGFGAWMMAIDRLFNAPAQSNTAGTTVLTDNPGLTIEPGKLHMSINAQFPPYAMVDDAGNYVGIDIELADAIARKLGLELVVDDMSFDASLVTVQMSRSDIAMGGIAATDERRTVMDFSEPYAKNIQVIIVKDGSPIATVDALSSAELVGVQENTTGHIYCSDPLELGGYGEEHVAVYDSGGAALLALLGNQVDAVVMDNAPAQAFAAAVPSLTILDELYADESYAVAVHKGNAALLDAVDQILAQLREDGTLQSILDKYLAVPAGEVEAVAALAGNDLLDQLDCVEFSENQLIFDYDSRFTIYLPFDTTYGLHYWLRRVRAAIDHPAVAAGQHYIVELQDEKAIRFLPK